MLPCTDCNTLTLKGFETLTSKLPKLYPSMMADLACTGGILNDSESLNYPEALSLSNSDTDFGRKKDVEPGWINVERSSGETTDKAAEQESRPWTGIGSVRSTDRTHH